MQKTHFSERVAARRAELGLSRAALAKAAKISSVSVLKWENGQNEPKGANLFALAKALRCSPTWLLYGDEEQLPIPAEQLTSELDDRQQRLLDLFDSLPESAKESHIIELEQKVLGFNNLLEELLEVRKNSNKTNK